MKKNKSAFTLIELLIYLAVLPIVLVMLTQIFHSILDVQLESEAASSVQTDGAFLLSRLQYDLLRADSISLPAALGQTSDRIEFTAGSDPFSYSVSDGILNLTSPLGTDSLNSQGSVVSDFSVTLIGNPLGDPTLKISFILTSSSLSLSGRPQIRNFSTTISLR